MTLTAGLIHALPPAERRVLSRGEAASYVGISPGHFNRLVKAGTLPGSLPAYGRTRRWDRVAIDRAVDRISGTTRPIADAPGAYDTWRSARG